MHYFQNMSSASGGFALRQSQTPWLCLWTPLGAFPQTANYPIPETYLAGAHVINHTLHLGKYQQLQTTVRQHQFPMSTTATKSYALK